MIKRILRFCRLPLSRQLQRIGFIWTSFVTRSFYGLRLRKLGKGTIIGRPIFWTPEYVEVGDYVLIWPGCRFEGINLDAASASTAPRIVLGDGVIMQQSCHVTAADQLTIGAGTLISFNVSIQDTDHRFDDVTSSVSRQPLIVKPTTIGNNCFIGARASIQAGTNLGQHCVVGANSVVRGNFPDYCVLVGAPAQVVKRYDSQRGMWRRTDQSGNFVSDSD